MSPKYNNNTIYLHENTKLFRQYAKLDRKSKNAKYFSFYLIYLINTTCILNLKFLCLLEVP